MDSSPPGSSVRGIFQVRILEWPCSPPGDLPDPGMEPRSPALQADSLPAEIPGKVTVLLYGNRWKLQSAGEHTLEDTEVGIEGCTHVMYVDSSVTSKKII